MTFLAAPLADYLTFAPKSPLTKEILAASRQTISLRMSRLLTLLFTVFLLPVLREAYLSERWPIVFTVVVGLALVAFAALVPRLDYRLRAVIVITATILVMAGESAAHGLVVDALPYALLTVILTTVLLDMWAGLGTLLTTIFLLSIVASLSRGGAIDLTTPTLQAYYTGQAWLWVVVKFIVFVPVTVYPLLWLLADTHRSLRQQRDLSQALAQERQLLNRRIETRRQALQTSLDISANLATLLDVDLLVNEVVNQVGAAFDYYHVQIYLLQRDSGKLHLVGGTGDAGAALLARDHSVEVGIGLVGRAASERELLLAPDVRNDPHWVPNPLLPDTRAEIAVPIIAADEVVGVLDVQHDLTEGLTADDMIVLQTVSNQVAIAVQNANLFQAAQRRAETVAMVNRVALNMRRETNLDDVLKSVVRELGDRVNAKEAAILIGVDKDKLRK